MGLFDFLKRPDLERGLAQFSRTPGAVLLDVRTPEEFAAGHIPESQNIPLHMLGQAGQLPDSLETPLFVYCQSGVRSRQAVESLRRAGYSHVTDLGGICHYHGKVVK